MSDIDTSTGGRPPSKAERRIERLRQVGRWLRYAGEDMLVAKEHAGGRPDAIARQACFHAQLAAEKAIKAGLVYLSREVPHHHDLDGLLQRLPRSWIVGQEVKASALSLATLTAWAVRARYPDDLPDADEADAREAVEIATRVCTYILSDLERLRYQPVWGPDRDPDPPVTVWLERILNRD